LGFYGENAVRYQEGYNAGYEEGYAEKSRMDSETEQFSTEEDRENAKAANANYMKTTGAKK
jgi:flagellar biosynthesis/type III secretory pathway protein FliH